MRKIILAKIFILFSISLFAQNNLKESVAIISPDYPKEKIDFFKSMSSTLMNEGYVTSARILRSLSLGGFGSGFVYQSDSGEKYIITNKHVVNDAPKVTIKFTTEEGDTLTYKDCDVLAISQDLDIAIISSKNIPNIYPLPLNNQPLHDGDEVWSVGYPALGKKPVWQLGKGIISNKDIKDEDFANPSITSILQHTAQIDPGSSGGPLLSRTKDNPPTFEIIGINTWKARNRESANYAIPAKAIGDFIEKTLTRKEQDDEMVVNKQAVDLVEKSNYKNIKEYISPEFVYQTTGASFSSMMKKVSEEARKDIEKKLKEGEPIEAIRLLIADAISQKINKKNESFSFTEIDNITRNKAVISFYSNKKKYLGEWTKEYGVWGISSFSAITVDEKLPAKKTVKDEFPSLNLSFKAAFSLRDDYANSYQIGFENIYIKYLTVHYAIGVGYKYEYYYYEQEREKEAFPFFESGVGGQFPITMSLISIIPYAKGIIGSNIEYNGIYTGARIGTNVGFNIKRTILYVGAEYSLKVTVLNLGNDGNMPNEPSIGVNLGIYF